MYGTSITWAVRLSWLELHFMHFQHLFLSSKSRKMTEIGTGLVMHNIRIYSP